MDIIRKLQHKEKRYVKKADCGDYENAGLNFVAIIGGVEQLRHPEFWL